MKFKQALDRINLLYSNKVDSEHTIIYLTMRSGLNIECYEPLELSDWNRYPIESVFETEVNHSLLNIVERGGEEFYVFTLYVNNDIAYRYFKNSYTVARKAYAMYNQIKEFAENSLYNMLL